MRLTEKALYVLGIGYAVLAFSIFPQWTVDDAYITFRYADNLAQSGELTYNIGEDPIEGYTGVAWPVLVALGIRSSVTPELFTHTAGISLYFFTALMLFLIITKIGIKGLPRACALLLYFTWPFLFTNALSGLETLLYVGSITASLALIVSYFERPSRRILLGSALALLITSFTRPEGVIFSIAAFGVLALFHKKSQRPFRSLLPALMLYGVPALAYFIWRATYYGALLPNTFYVKTSGGLHFNHIKDLIHFVALYMAAPISAGFVLLASAGEQGVARARERGLKTSAVTYLGYIALVYCGTTILHFTTAVLKMNFSYRFFVPFVPFFLIGCAILFTVGSQWTRLKTEARAFFLLLAGFVTIAGAYQALTVTHRLKDEMRFARHYQSLLASQHIPAGKAVAELVPKNEWLVVLYDAGAIPYFSGLKTIDLGGLNDEKIAHERLSGKDLAEYFFVKNPGAAVFSTLSTSTIQHSPVSALIARDPRFTKNYTLTRHFAPGAEVFPGTYYEVVYVRNDLIKK